MKKSEKVKFFFINFIFFIALCVILVPLLMVAKYNYPLADDWSFGWESYQAIRKGAGLITVLKCSLKIVAQNYMKWEGRFAATFFASLQPGIWGEQYYSIVAWLMLGGLILGELVFFGFLLNYESRGKNRLLWLPIVISTLILQILYTPSTVESFYWYTGSINYTFVFGLSLVLLALFVKLAQGKWKGWRFGVVVFISCLLAVMVGGDNFATSLSSFLTMMVLSVLYLFIDRKALLRTWYITLLTGGSFLICLLAPGNKSRLAANFNAGTTGNAVGAVWMSLVRSFTNIYSWMNLPILLMIVIILPFVWMAVKNIEYDFKWPGVFTLVTFGLYASQITSTMYVDGTTGGLRMAAILYYSYHIWLVGNVCYWIGWLHRVRQKWPAIMERGFAAAVPTVRRFPILYCAIVGGILVSVIYVRDLKILSSYNAYRDWRQGWVQQYALEWEDRLEVLHDESITQVEFAPLSVCPATVVYADLQDEDGYIWVNNACALYYGKEYVRIVNEQALNDKFHISVKK